MVGGGWDTYSGLLGGDGINSRAGSLGVGQHRGG